MDDESIFCVIKESETDPLLDLLSESNHVSFLKNMKADLFRGISVRLLKNAYA